MKLAITRYASFQVMTNSPVTDANADDRYNNENKSQNDNNNEKCNDHDKVDD